MQQPQQRSSSKQRREQRSTQSIVPPLLDSLLLLLRMLLNLRSPLRRVVDASRWDSATEAQTEQAQIGREHWA